MRLIIAITGASGSIYGIRLLEFLNTRKDIETHLIMSATAGTVIPYETAYARIEQVQRLATFCYQDNDLAAPVASGTFITAGMIVAPCSAKTHFRGSPCVRRDAHCPGSGRLLEGAQKAGACFPGDPADPCPY